MSFMYPEGGGGLVNAHRLVAHANTVMKLPFLLWHNRDVYFCLN